MANFFIQPWDIKDDSTGHELDQYAIMNSHAFVDLFGKTMPEASTKEIEGLLKITYKGKSIYRKYLGSNITESGNIILNNRSIAELGLKTKDIEENPNMVEIEPASVWAYLYNNSYSYIRDPFKLAIIGLAATILFGIISTIIGIISLCECSCF